MSTRFVKASALTSGMVIALPFGKTATVESVRAGTYYMHVRWTGELSRSRYRLDEEVLLEELEVSTEPDSFRVRRVGGDRPFRAKKYEISDHTERMLYEFIAPDGDRLGVSLNPDGTLTVGGWDEAGEWVDLEVKRLCQVPECRVPGNRHVMDFPLNQYQDESD